MNIQLKKGLLDVCVLTSLSKVDSYGYKMIEDIGKHIEISESTLYPILKRLELSDCLETYKEEHNGRLRKYYRITEIGKQRLEEFREEWKKLEKAFKYVLGGKNEKE